MTFSSFSYFLFLPAVFLFFYACPDRWRWLVLLVASYLFYAFLDAPYLLAVLFCVTVIGYACGLALRPGGEESVRRRWLWGGSFSCVAVLALFKYLPALAAQGVVLPGVSHGWSDTLLSVGVSYFTFQAISYLADIYLELEEPEPHFGRFALYMAFFPKLLQGPIERCGDLIPQLKRPYRFDYQAMRSGMLLFGWGLFKKLVVAERLAVYADSVYDKVHDHTGISLLIGTYAYALQIYFDFSAYTDMARGTGRMFGIELSENFRQPYLATTVAEFWRRWHISFSRWILDYIFKPLQMGWRHLGQAGSALALLVTFLISGIWHGATWGFVIWGGLHGLYLACSTYYRPYQKRLHKWLGVANSRWLKWWQVFVTFNLVSFAWVFFRANSLADARYVVAHLPDWSGNLSALREAGGHAFIRDALLLGNGRGSFVVLALLLTAATLFGNGRILSLLERPARWRWVAYYALAFAILGLKMESTKFIYLNF